MTDAADNRRYPPRPIVGVGGVLFRGDTVLLGLRGKEPGRGKWSLPGGAVRLGETLEDALRRELQEEVGVTVTVRHVVAVLDRVIRDGDGRVAYHYVLVDFLCDCTDDRAPQPGSDLLDCRYVPLRDLGAYHLTRGTEEVIRHAYTTPLHVLSVIYDKGS